MADPDESLSARRGQPFRAFVGRHQGILGTTLFVVLGGGGILAWHRWDLWWLESTLVQGALILVACVGFAALSIWGEGALPPDDDPPAPRRSRGGRETARPRGWRRRGRKGPARGRRST